MSNSPLVSYTKISPNKTSPRNHKIDTITIHCVVGQTSVETLGNVFAPASRKASSNYGVGYDGRIGMYVEEKDRSWCTSSSANDNRAITIEVASDTKHPYAVTDKALEATIELCVDICKRNGIKQLLWKGDKNLIGQVDKQNMTVHRWFANKSCPGEYLYSKHLYIAAEVNKRLNPPKPTPKPDSKVLYRVQTGAFSNKANADALEAKLKKAGFDTYMVKVENLYKVQVGAFGVKANADTMAKKLKAAGFDTYITTESRTPVQSNIKAPTLKVGSKVKVTGTNYATGQSIPSFVRNNTYTIQQISGDKVLLKEIISWVYKKDVKLV
jgi:N-acetyl-anhydromuramyl-L-alanine amidase AmpD/TusA-related sulfurtransferase